MARKRKTESNRQLDEVDRSVYSTFCTAANSLSHLYAQSMNQQKISFQAGEHHALEKLYQWILRKHEEGSRVTVSDIISRIQNEIENGGEDAPMSPRLQCPNQYPPAALHFPNTGTTIGLAPRPSHSDQIKNSVFSNALSGPVRHSLQPYHQAQNGVLPSGKGLKNNDASSGSNSPGSNESSMDM